MDENEEKFEIPAVKRHHPPYRTLSEIIFKQTDDITAVFRNYAERGIQFNLDTSPSNYKFVLSQVPFSVEQLEGIINSMDKGITLLMEMEREDVTAYEELKSYFNKRLKKANSKKPTN